jgi:acyl carrier protein
MQTIAEPNTRADYPAIYEETQLWLTNRLSEMLQIAPESVDPEKSLAAYGLGSSQGMELTGDLEQWLGRKLPATLIWDYPTIVSIAEYVSKQ